MEKVVIVEGTYASTCVLEWHFPFLWLCSWFLPPAFLIIMQATGIALWLTAAEN